MSLELFIYAGMLLESEKSELSDEDKRRRDRRTPRIAIRRYSKLPFLYLYKSGDNQALLNCCGVYHPSTFLELLHMFAHVFNLNMFDENTGRIQKTVLTKKGLPKGRKQEMNTVYQIGSDWVMNHSGLQSYIIRHTSRVSTTL